MRKVNPRENNGRIILQFSYQGKRYSLTQGYWNNKADKAIAQKIANQIYLDCELGVFDTSLAKYKTADKIQAEQTTPQTLENLLQARLDKQWSVSIDATLKNLRRFGIVNSPETARAFVKYLLGRVKPQTAKRYVDNCKAVAKEWFQDISITVPAKAMPKPFSKHEVHAILEAFKHSPYYSHYYDYVYFLMATGMRTSEAVGCRWCDIDFERNEITIAESLAKEKNNPCKRIRKTTKTNKVRAFPISNGLLDMLKKRYESLSPVDLQSLVFTSPKGLPINDNNFTKRAWKKCLEQAKVPYRCQYNTRHTFISHMLEAGINPVKVAAITGHDVKTLLGKYAGVIDRIEIPDLF